VKAPAGDCFLAAIGGLSLFAKCGISWLKSHIYLHPFTRSSKVGPNNKRNKASFLSSLLPISIPRALRCVAAPQQTQAVIDLSQQRPRFFNLVLSHALEGYYGAPRQGGNRNAASWRMVGIAAPPLRGRAQYDERKGADS